MINVAIVGTGSIANAHVKGLLTFPERCKIVALCDIYSDKAQAMKEKYQLDCIIYDDHQKMLSSGQKIDLVHICTPPYVHAEIAIHAMEAGCNVLTEKPMATCLEECDRMLACEKENGVTLGCIAQNRFRNPIYKLKKLADSRIAGKICCAQINSFWWRGHSYYDLWWRGTWQKEGGGPTLNHAVHHIDMLNWIEGEMPEEVSAMMSNVMHDNSEVEDISVAAMRYHNGSMAQVTSSVIHHGEEQSVILQCADAKISAPLDHIKANISLKNGFPQEEENKELIQKIQDYYDSLPDLKYEGHTGEIDNVLFALENHERPLITGEDGRRTVELISAIYKSGCQKKVVKLPIEPTDDYYTFDGIMKHAIHFYEKAASVENFDEEQISLGRI